MSCHTFASSNTEKIMKMNKSPDDSITFRKKRRLCKTLGEFFNWMPFSQSALETDPQTFLQIVYKMHAEERKTKIRNNNFAHDL